MPTPPDTLANARRLVRRRRRWAALLLLAGICAATWFARARLGAWVATRVARDAGYELVCDDLAIDSLARVRAGNVEVRARTATSALRTFRAQDLAIDLDPGALLRGAPWVDAVHAVSASAEIDLARGGTGGGGTFAFEALRALPAASVGALDLAVRADTTALGIARARIVFAPTARGDETLLEIHADEARVARGERSGSAPLAARLRLDERGQLSARAELSGLATLVVDGLGLEPDGGASGAIDLATPLGNAVVTLKLEAGELRARGFLADLDLAALLDLLGADAAGWSGRWSAVGAAVVPLDDPGRFTADVELATGVSAIAGRAFDAIEGRVLVDRDHISVGRALLLSGANAAIVERARIPRDADLACDFLARTTVDLDVDLQDPAAVLGAAWTLPADAPPHRVRARAQLADGWLALPRASAEIGASRLDLRSTRLPLLGGPILDPATELVLDVRAPDAGELARLVLPAEAERELALAGAVDGSVRLATARDGIAARLDLSVRAGSVRGVAIESLAVRATAQSGQLDIDRVEARAGRNVLFARGGIDLAARRFADLRFDLAAPDLAELLRALGVADAPVFGAARLSAGLDGSLADPTGVLELDAESLGAGGVDVAWLRVRAHGARGAFEVTEAAALLPAYGAVRAAGSVAFDADGGWRARLERLDLAAEHGAAALAGPARLAGGRGVVSVEDLCLASADGALRVRDARVDGSLCADVDLLALRPARLLGVLGVAAPRSLAVDGGVGLAVVREADGGCDGPLRVDLAVAVDEPRAERASGVARAAIALSGTLRAPRGTIALEGRSLAWRGPDGTGLVAGLDVDARVRIGETLELVQADVRAGDAFSARAAGAWHIAPDLDRLARRPADAWRTAPIEARVDVDAANLAPISEAFRTLRRVQGTATARVDVAGTLERPVVSGRATLRGGGLKLAASLPALSDMDVAVVLDGRTAVIESARGNFGGGEFTLAGSLDESGAEPVLDLRFAGQSLPLLRTAAATVRADADLLVSGPWSALALSGTAVLRDARVEQRLDLGQLREAFAASPSGGRAAPLEVPAITEPPFDAMSIDVAVRSTEPVRVRTPLLQAAVRTDLAIRGTGAAPILLGSLDLASGRIALPASELDLARGRVEFDPSEPGRARIDVTAEGRVSGYEVRARLTGSADEPLVELSSIPPADEEDLVLLLLAGRTPGSRSLDGSRVVGEVASIVARDFAYQWFGDAAEDLADRLEFASGGDVTQSGADTINVRFRVLGPSRGAGRAIYMRGERDLYDRFNMGLRFVLRMP